MASVRDILFVVSILMFNWEFTLLLDNIENYHTVVL